ncbi:10408_t:CDS:2, partial [Paraglomus occultum]
MSSRFHNHKRSNSDFIANDPFRDIEKNALSIFDAQVPTTPRRRHSELIPNDPFRQIELNAEKIFDAKPKARRRHSYELIPNDPFRTIELHAPEIFGDLPTHKQKIATQQGLYSKGLRVVISGETGFSRLFIVVAAQQGLDPKGFRVDWIEGFRVVISDETGFPRLLPNRHATRTGSERVQSGSLAVDDSLVKVDFTSCLIVIATQQGLDRRIQS